ncbi:MAG: RNA 2',3'-cyclic phosphodiesterase [Acidobacteria bacterium]|nr:RNA 2',3'-cyclic phosphodiesterase [Acidobacteriota bacterium]MBI3664056.1 RNA 2',3'-cyclic phosphodiesterase [Acidobacteriota bacterium]
MRVFVAMDVPEEVRRAIGEFVAKLEPVCRGARWARVDGMHVTLKYIGEVTAEKVEQIKKELEGVRSAEAVEMNFRGMGFFPNAKHPRVFWAGIEATPNLAEISAEMEKRMERLGIAREERAFRPHLTLARFKTEEGLAKLHEAIEKAGAVEFGSTRSSEFYLYESKLLRGGAEYTRLARFAFAAEK